MKAVLCLGKLGDIISVLPCLYQDHKETGVKSHLIVATKYAHVLEGVEYVEPVLWSGDWQDVDGALMSAKARYRDVVVAQMHAEGYVPRRQFPSFQLDQWHRCGRLKQWGTLPLIYPSSGHPVDSKFILLGDASESSPFPKIEELFVSLVKEFPSHRIVRLSTVRLPLLADLLALYDAADLIVTIDTLHAHLSAATKTPVIVLATDKPSRWHGTAFHPRMAMHCRYGDYDLKKDQLLHVAKLCVNKSPMPVVVKEKTGQPYGYNMSLLKMGNNVWKTYRYHPGKTWRTELMLIRDGQEIPIIPPQKYAHFSIEDGRLFLFKNKPHISVTVARSRGVGMTVDPCIQGYGELQPDGKIANWAEPQVGRNDWTGQEKNWCFWEHGGRLHVSYTLSPIHVVYAFDERGKVRNEYRTHTPPCSFGEPRGGTQMLPWKDNKWLKFFHANQVNKKSDASQNYHVGALLMQDAPPFRITAVGRHPILSGNEMFSEAPKWKTKCKLVYGAAKNNEGYEISLGSNDCECETAYVWEKQLNL